MLLRNTLSRKGPGILDYYADDVAYCRDLAPEHLLRWDQPANIISRANRELLGIYDPIELPDGIIPRQDISDGYNVFHDEGDAANGMEYCAGWPLDYWDGFPDNAEAVDEYREQYVQDHFFEILPTAGRYLDEPWRTRFANRYQEDLELIQQMWSGDIGYFIFGVEDPFVCPPNPTPSLRSFSYRFGEGYRGDNEFMYIHKEYKQDGLEHPSPRVRRILDEYLRRDRDTLRLQEEILNYQLDIRKHLLEVRARDDRMWVESMWLDPFGVFISAIWNPETWFFEGNKSLPREEEIVAEIELLRTRGTDHPFSSVREVLLQYKRYDRTLRTWIAAVDAFNRDFPIEWKFRMDQQFVAMMWVPETSTFLFDTRNFKHTGSVEIEWPLDTQDLLDVIHKMNHERHPDVRVRAIMREFRVNGDRDDRLLRMMIQRFHRNASIGQIDS